MRTQLIIYNRRHGYLSDTSLTVTYCTETPPEPFRITSYVHGWMDERQSALMSSEAYWSDEVDVVGLGLRW